MGFFENGNPVCVFAYFMAVSLCTMFSADPVTVAVSLLGAVVTRLCLGGRGHWREHGFVLVLFLAGTVINPVFNHNGTTVLFFVNDNPITLEALFYGAVSSGAVVAVIYWFRAFSAVMTGDRLLYVFGIFSPKLALMLSMALRYIPLFGDQARKVDIARTASGAGGGESLPDRIRSKLGVFWVMVTWTLENGIVTADSMEARGYGCGRRSFFSLYRFRLWDGVVLGASLLLFGLFCAAKAVSALDFQFYPSLAFGDWGIMSLFGRGAYFLLAFMPAIIKSGEEIKWKFLLSGI